MNAICPNCNSVVYEKNLNRHLKSKKCQSYNQNVGKTKNSAVSLLVYKNAELSKRVDILSAQLQYTEQLFIKLASSLNIDNFKYMKSSSRRDASTQTVSNVHVTL